MQNKSSYSGVPLSSMKDMSVRVLAALHLIWSLGLTAWTTSTLLLISYAQTEFAVAYPAGWCIALPALAASVLNLWIACTAIVVNRYPRVGSILIVAGIVASFMPPLVRAVLPWEDTRSGDGSPLATLLGIVFLCVVGGAFCLAGCVGLMWHSRIGRAGDPVDDHIPIEPEPFDFNWIKPRDC